MVYRCANRLSNTSSHLCQGLLDNCLLAPPSDPSQTGIEQQVLHTREEKQVIGHYKWKHYITKHGCTPGATYFLCSEVAVLDVKLGTHSNMAVDRTDLGTYTHSKQYYMGMARKKSWQCCVCVEHSQLSAVGGGVCLLPSPVHSHCSQHQH